MSVQAATVWASVEAGFESGTPQMTCVLLLHMHADEANAGVMISKIGKAAVCRRNSHEIAVFRNSVKACGLAHRVLESAGA